MTQPLTHPAWCNPAHCTVIGELLPLTGTAHRSGTFEIDLGPFAPAALRRLTGRLVQAAKPWPVDVFVVVTDTAQREVVSMRVAAARALLAHLGGILAQADEGPYATVQPPADVPPGAIVGVRPRHCRHCGYGRMDGFHGGRDGMSLYRCQTCGHEWRELGPGRVAVLETVDIHVVAGGINSDECRDCGARGEAAELLGGDDGDTLIGWRCPSCGRRWSTPSVPREDTTEGQP